MRAREVPASERHRKGLTETGRDMRDRLQKIEHADISHLSFGKSLASPILPEQYHGLLMILFRNRGSLLFYVVCSSLDPIAIVYPPELILGSLLRGP